jgi:hypothetical protein
MAPIRAQRARSAQRAPRSGDGARYLVARHHRSSEEARTADSSRLVGLTGNPWLRTAPADRRPDPPALDEPCRSPADGQIPQRFPLDGELRSARHARLAWLLRAHARPSLLDESSLRAGGSPPRRFPAPTLRGSPQTSRSLKSRTSRHAWQPSSSGTAGWGKPGWPRCGTDGGDLLVDQRLQVAPQVLVACRPQAAERARFIRRWDLLFGRGGLALGQADQRRAEPAGSSTVPSRSSSACTSSSRTAVAALATAAPAAGTASPLLVAGIETYSRVNMSPARSSTCRTRASAACVTRILGTSRLVARGGRAQGPDWTPLYGVV